MGFKASEVQDFIGKGITLPLQLEGGKTPLKSGFDLIRASIVMVLSWPYATRFFIKQFGSRLEELLEEPNDDVLFSLVETFVIDSLKEWEPRVELTGLEITRNDLGGIKLLITYRVLSIQQEDTFIFPFYTQIAV
jgi:hypothetical protein